MTATAAAQQQLDQLTGSHGLIEQARREGYHPLRAGHDAGPITRTPVPAMPQPGEPQLLRAAHDAEQRIYEALRQLEPHATTSGHDVHTIGKLLAHLLAHGSYPQGRKARACHRVHLAHRRLAPLLAPPPQPDRCDTDGCTNPQQDGRRCYRCRRHRERKGSWPQLTDRGTA